MKSDIARLDPLMFSNFQFLGNMALVSLYQYWEDFHRGQVATELGIKRMIFVL